MIGLIQEGIRFAWSVRDLSRGVLLHNTRICAGLVHTKLSDGSSYSHTGIMLTCGEVVIPELLFGHVFATVRIGCTSRSPDVPGRSENEAFENRTERIRPESEGQRGTCCSIRVRAAFTRQ